MGTMFFDISVCPDCKEIITTKLMPAHKYASHDNKDFVRTAKCGCVLSKDKGAAAVEPCRVLQPRLDSLPGGRPEDLHQYLAHLERAWDETFHGGH
jgi:hypothetical protein